MFGRKKSETEGDNAVAIPTEAEAARAAMKPAQAAQAPRPANYAPAAAAKPEPRKPQEHPRASSANGNGNGHGHAHGNGGNESKRLIVGRDIMLNGAINSCDKLIVEGRVEATLSDCREMEIAETGTFKGEAAVDVAVVSGRFEGTLQARELLLVRAKGSVSGNVRFSRLEVERGGEIEGQVAVIGAGVKDRPAAAPRLGTTGNGANGNGAGVHDEAGAS
jgi:cytoskeletal protein CcmA (bactofilin family)